MTISEKPFRAGEALQIAGPTTQERRKPVEHKVFEHPVTIIVGLGLPREVNTVLEAYAILNEWPPSSRSTAHAMALNACKQLSPARSRQLAACSSPSRKGMIFLLADWTKLSRRRPSARSVRPLRTERRFGRHPSA